MTVPQAQDQFPFLKRFVNNWPLYDIVSRFLRNHSRYMQTKFSGLDVTQGGSVDSEVDKGDAGDAPNDPQGEEENEMDVEEENGMDVEEGEHDEEENEMDVEDGEHDPQTDENVIGPQVPHPPPPSHPVQSKAPSTTKTLERRVPKKGSRPDPDSQAAGGPSQSHRADPPPPSHPVQSKAPPTTKTLERRAPKKGSRPDPDSQAAGGPSQSHQVGPPPPSHPSPSKEPAQSKSRPKQVQNSNATGNTQLHDSHGEHDPQTSESVVARSKHNTQEPSQCRLADPQPPFHPGVSKAPSTARPKTHEKRAPKNGSRPDSRVAAAPPTPTPNKTQSRPRPKQVGNSKLTGTADTVSPQAPSTISATIKIPPKHLRTKGMLEHMTAHPKRAMDDAQEDTETSPPAKKSRNTYAENVVCPSSNNARKG